MVLNFKKNNEAEAGIVNIMIGVNFELFISHVAYMCTIEHINKRLQHYE